MDRKKLNKTEWIQLGLMSSFIVAVVIMAVMIFRMQSQLETLGRQGKRDTALLPSDSATSKVSQPDKHPTGTNDDWFSNPFDPNKWDPFSEMQRMQEHIDRVFSDSFSRFGKSPRFHDLVRDPGFSPKIDVHEEKDKFVIRLDLPGVDEGSVDVQVEGQDVQISGKKDDIVTDKDKDGHVVRQERRTGSFSRSIELPEAVDPNKMTAKNDNGVFTIVLPKA